MESPVISLYAEGSKQQRLEASAYLVDSNIAYYSSGSRIRVRLRNSYRINAVDKQLREFGLKTWRVYDRHN